MQWFIVINGAQAGPFTEAQLQSMVATGQLTPQTLVWKPGDRDWMPAHTLPWLFAGQSSPAQGNIYAPPAAGGYSPAMHNRPMPSNNLVWSILCTVLCCIPFGIVAIVYSCKVEGLYLRGDYNGAVSAANTARTWCLVSVGLGLLFGVLSVTFGSH